MVELTSSRLTMRQIAKADRELFFALHRDATVMRYVANDLPDDREIEKRFESRLVAWQKNTGRWLCLTVFTRKGNRAIGVTGLKLNSDGYPATKGPLHAEVGYLFLPEHQGKGYGTESLHSVKEYARDVIGVKQLTALVVEDNLSSLCVLEKCGFVCNRRLSGSFRSRDKICDELMYVCNI